MRNQHIYLRVCPYSTSEDIISCISNIVFSQITEFMEWKGLRHKKSHVFKKISIRSLKWVYDITETVLCTMHGVGEKPWRSFTSVKQDWHQLKVNQNLQESKRNCFYFDKLQTSTCSCTIFVIVSSVGCGLCNSTATRILGHLVTYHILLSALLIGHSSPVITWVLLS